MSDLDEFAKAQAVEYGTYVAKVAIFHDGVRAYNPGDPVPVSNVKAHGYDKDGLVEKTAKSPADAAPAVTPTTAKV